jgi:hypothetical protein
MIDFIIKVDSQDFDETTYRIGYKGQHFFETYPDFMNMKIDNVLERIQDELSFEFKTFLKTDNVCLCWNDCYLEQTTQWRKRFSYNELKDFYTTEYFIQNQK